MTRLLFALLFVLVFCKALHAEEISTDEESFAQKAAQLLQRELPDYKVKITRRMTLGGTRPDGSDMGEISLDRAHGFCHRNPRDCAAALGEYTKGIGESLKERDRPIDKSMIRLAVRPSDYVDQLKQRMGPGPAGLFSRPLAGNLVIVPVLDFARSMRFAGEKDLKDLGLSEDELFAVGEANLKAHDRPISEVTQTLKRDSIGVITGEDYASSRLLSHAEWRPLSEGANGNLVVMVPAPNLLLYTDGSTPVALEALRGLGAEQAKRSSRPLSQVVLRWTPSGWQVVP